MNRRDEFFENISQEELAKLNVISAQIQFFLGESFKHGDPSSVIAQRAASLHKDWIEMVYGNYDQELHRELAIKYSKENTDSQEEGEFFKEAIFIFINDTEEKNGE